MLSNNYRLRRKKRVKKTTTKKQNKRKKQICVLTLRLGGFLIHWLQT